MTQLALFEDVLVDRFLPLVWRRPVYDLRCGIRTLRDKVASVYGRSVDALFARSFLTTVLEERAGLSVNTLPQGQEILLLSGRILANSDLAKHVPPDGPEALYLDDEGVVVAARLSVSRLRSLEVNALGESLDPVAPPLRDVERYPFEGRLIEWMWDLVHHNTEEIVSDAGRYALGTHAGVIADGAHLVAPNQIYIAENASIAPGAVLDASDGPIVIEAGAQVMANSVIVGPAAVGPQSRIKIGAKIYEGTSLGPVCKAGGEIEETIFQGYSNKQHDGFFGHGYVSEWCNLGAHTSNSDLKNNYSPVRVWTNGEMRDSGELFVGTFMGDHTKTGIGVLLNTGTVLGVACNVYGAELPAKFVPSFTWGQGNTLVEHRLAKAIETAGRIMARRDVELTKAETDLLTYIFARTQQERRNYGIVEDET